MESHLHTLHLVKCNNEHKIIKSRVKAICRKLYNSRLELEWKQVCVDKISLLLKVYTRKSTHSGGRVPREEVMFRVWNCTSVSVFYEGHRSQGFFMVGRLPGYPGIALSLFSISSLNLIHKLLGR